MVGFISPTNVVGTYGKTRQPVHKKYLVGNNNQKNMKLVNERAVDSHFQISKTSPVSFATKSNMENSETKNMRKDTEPPRQINFIDQKIEIQHRKNQTQTSLKKVDSQNAEQKKITDLNDPKNHVNNALFKPNIQKHLENRNVIEKSKNQERSQFKPVPTVHAITQKKWNRFINRQQFFDQNYYQKPNGLSVKNKILHKANINSEHNAQYMNYMLNEIAQKFLENKKSKIKENRKRDAITNNVMHQRIESNDKDDANSNYKYNIKDNPSHIFKNHKGNYPARTDNSDPTKESNGTPYALFYLMNHDNIGQTDLFSPNQDKITIEEILTDVNDKTDLMSYSEDRVKSKTITSNTKTENYSAFRDR